MVQAEREAQKIVQQGMSVMRGGVVLREFWFMRSGANYFCAFSQRVYVCLPCYFESTLTRYRPHEADKGRQGGGAEGN